MSLSFIDNDVKSRSFIDNLLCCPLLVPQMTGGTLPAGPVNEKVSVRHCVAVLTAFPAAVAVLPPTSHPLDKVIVVGPAITKLLKSSRIWKYIVRQILSLKVNLIHHLMI